MFFELIDVVMAIRQMISQSFVRRDGHFSTRHFWALERHVFSIHSRRNSQLDWEICIAKILRGAILTVLVCVTQGSVHACDWFTNTDTPESSFCVGASRSHQSLMGA